MKYPVLVSPWVSISTSLVAFGIIGFVVWNWYWFLLWYLIPFIALIIYGIRR